MVEQTKPLNAGDSDQPNQSSEEHVEVMEIYDLGPAAKKQKFRTFENMQGNCKVMFECFFKYIAV